MGDVTRASSIVTSIFIGPQASEDRTEEGYYIDLANISRLPPMWDIETSWESFLPC